MSWFGWGGASAQLKDSSPLIRLEAVRDLHHQQGVKALPQLLKMLADPHAEVRLATIECLGSLRDERTLQPLLSVLDNPKETYPLRQAAHLALAPLGSPVVRPLLERLDQAATPNRAELLALLGQIEDPQVIPALIARLTDEDIAVRKEAAFTLGQRQASEAIQPLLQALRDERWLVRAEAALALARLKDKAALEGLLAAQRDEHWLVVQSVCIAIAQIRDPRALRALFELAQHPDEPVVRTAVEMLGRFGHPAAIKPLLSFLANPEFARTALDALAALMRESAARLAVDDLQVLAQLKDVQHAVYEANEGDLLSPPVCVSRRLNCQPVRTLAHAELASRSAAQ